MGRVERLHGVMNVGGVMEVGAVHAHECVLRQSGRVTLKAQVERLAHVADLRHHVLLILLGLEVVNLWIVRDRAGAHRRVQAERRGLLRVVAHN